MDGLMLQATDLILSNNEKFEKDLNAVFKFERRTSLQDLTDPSSINLMRMSIAKTLKDRSQSEVIDSTIVKQRKHRRRRGSLSGKPKVEVELLDPEIKITSDQKNHRPGITEEQNNFDVPESDLTKLFTEDQNSEETVHSQSELKQIETNEEAINNYNTTENNEKESVQHNRAEIGLKLAQRNFSDSIFENCSTYSLTCSEVPREKEHTDNFSNDKTSKSDSVALYFDDDKKSKSADNDNNSDDQISLTDSFFVSTNSDDNVSINSLPSKNSSNENKSSRFSISKAKSNAVSNEIKLDFDTEKWQQKNERKLNKKERKKQKRSKSNDVPMYSCPKCNVTYILSNNASRSAACCLHCDFWKSVEPVFLKREKQPWNTCRIC